jgi:hypothetical protein
MSHVRSILAPLGLAGALLAAPTLASDSTDYALEPCINGQVSASGTHATQALETASTASAAHRELALEPCINGAVSASGEFPSQELEDTAKRGYVEPDRIGSGADDAISEFGGYRNAFTR